MLSTKKEKNESSMSLFCEAPDLKRERERERETDRQTDRQTERQLTWTYLKLN